VMSTTAQVGVPEVKLGLFPGFGGTVRLPRVASERVGLEWVVGGKPCGAVDALHDRVVDAVGAPELLRAEAMAHLIRCVEGQVDWRVAQQRKREPVASLDGPAYDEMLARLARDAAKHQPAAEMAVRMMREAAVCDRRRALELEAAAFGAVTQTQAASSMVQTFLNEQAVRKITRRHAEGARPVSAVAVIGAGDHAAAIRSTIKPQPKDADFDNVDLVIDALAFDVPVRHQVLKRLQSALKPGTVLASSTASLRIDDIAAALPHPDDVVGLHFFDPVPVVPLVEVVRGCRSSDAAVATATAYARALGKIPVVVKDCPGFLVDRVFTPYLIAFCQLVADGAEYERVDQALEAFGWSSGPAHRLDVVGLDRASHDIEMIAAGYAHRMELPARNAIRLLLDEQRSGRTSGAGFYNYDGMGDEPERRRSPEARALIGLMQQDANTQPDGAQIIERTMLPMLLEAIRCLEEGVAGSAAELDLAMLLGVGFPAYLGGPLKYADWIGLPRLLARCEALAGHGPMYAPPALLRQLAARDSKFHEVA
jgi:3-hydroxyacyl-CoA dehydrogenase/enoyl-CoA hydratase/3-hydroxybutyryl-CoA epimerase/enoyl-CoA isomerase